jgi:hypothetical protein
MAAMEAQPLRVVTSFASPKEVTKKRRRKSKPAGWCRHHTSREISAGMCRPIERHAATGRNLNARDKAAHPHRVRFPGLGTTIVQRHLNAQSYRNRPQCAAGEHSRAFNSGASAQISWLRRCHSAPEFRQERWWHNAVGFDFGLPSLVTFFGGAKKVTDAFRAWSCCVVPLEFS